MKTWMRWAAAAGMWILAGAAQAAPLALQDLGNGTVKDPNTNLIWLKDWSTNGQKDWTTQWIWSEDLDFAGSARWRLPLVSEYQALFDVFGDLTKVAVFENVVAADYWSREQVQDVSRYRTFDPSDGRRLNRREESPWSAVAVRSADATTAVPVPVPEPQTLALVLLALGATAAVRRTRPS